MHPPCSPVHRSAQSPLPASRPPTHPSHPLPGRSTAPLFPPPHASTLQSLSRFGTERQPSLPHLGTPTTQRGPVHPFLQQPAPPCPRNQSSSFLLRRFHQLRCRDGLAHMPPRWTSRRVVPADH